MSDDRSAQPPANRLARETSPYLQQHAHNPVDWYPWGDEALDRARREDRPILLSVGYSACHWCHVMERECFEAPPIARQMNEGFVNIKVDREERPDIDEIYMTAVQAMTGSGGWPLTVFLTPDLRPFYGGTYFPPEDRYGRAGFPRVLEAVSEHYRSQRDRVETQATRLRDVLEQSADPLTRGGNLDADGAGSLLRDAARQLVANHDERFGGFSQTGPKFPNHAALSLLLRQWHDDGDEAALRAATHSLRHMARGGIYDQLGGGFHRYSVDERWLVPHFEKMLYDNALLVPVYVDAWQVTGEPLFARIVRETLDYVVREMTTADGGYAATQDADSEGEEGRFFVWTPEQVEAVIDDEATAALVCHWFDVTAHGNFEGGTSILHVDGELDEQARLGGVSPENLQAAIDAGRPALLAARQQRVAPARDDKVLASWNGLMISAMCRGSQALDGVDWLPSATKAAHFCLEQLVVDGQLRHAWKDGRAPVAAFQDDYAALVAGLVDLYEATCAAQWLGAARDLARQMIERFWDEEGGGFWFAEAGRADLLVRTKNPYDGATPSGNSLAAMALLRLGALTGEERFLQCARRTLQAYADLLRRTPTACPAMACALHQSLRGPVEVTVVGPEAPRQALLREVHRRYLPRRVISGAAAGDAAAVELMPALRERLTHEPAAFVCRDAACSAPVTSAAELAALLAPAVREAAA